MSTSLSRSLPLFAFLSNGRTDDLWTRAHVWRTTVFWCFMYIMVYLRRLFLWLCWTEAAFWKCVSMWGNGWVLVVFLNTFPLFHNVKPWLVRAVVRAVATWPEGSISGVCTDCRWMAHKVVWSFCPGLRQTDQGGTSPSPEDSTGSSEPQQTTVAWISIQT